MNILQDLINAGKGAVRAAGAPVHVAQQIGQQVAQEMTHAGGPVAGAMQGGQGLGQGVAQALGVGQTNVPFKNGFYPPPYDPSRQLGQNPTKIPYKNGFYAGPFDPSRQLPGQMQAQQPQGIPLLAQMAQLGAPAGQALQNGMQGGQYNPGLTPMQGSQGVGPMQGGQDVYWQNLDGVRRNMYNPQVSDNGFFYDN